MKKKLILFDWGNIVEAHTTGYTCADARNDLFVASGYKGKEIIFRKISKYRLTKITSIEEFGKTFEEMAKDFNFNVPYEKFIELYYKIFANVDYYQDVADFEVSLKDKCYIGILSNLTIFDKERLDKQVDLSKYDYVFLSFEIGYKKPDKNIFEIVSKQLPFKPENILFIDDKDDNIDMAKKFGGNVLKANGLELEKIKSYCDAFLGNIE
jgi:HAD superfamily hydrolase (TIGR01509 family)